MAVLGRLLDVDLSEGRVRISDLREEVSGKFLGGRGLNVWLLQQNLAENVDPLQPGNVLILSCGLLTGTPAPAASRLHVSSKSPLTGLLGSSNVGGGFGVGLRSCGVQCIRIRGRADTPVYLRIGRGKAEIREARFLWGLDTWETEDRLKEELAQGDLETMTIGPAGEKLVPFACIMANHDHAAGRTGMGAVMGSKNLKAIVVQCGDRQATVSPSTASAIRRYVKRIKKSPRFRNVSTYGSAGDIRWTHEMGMLATRNYSEVQFEDFSKIDGREMEKYVTRRKGCYRCPVCCKADVTIDRGEFEGMVGTRPEFEPIIALGSKCGLGQTEALLYLCDLCSRLGVDSISAGSVIAFAMDLYARGILTPEDTGGIDLRWGNYKAMEALLHQIAGREGLGAVLSQGVRQAAQIIGKGADRFAYHAKGLELTGYDPRALMGTALGYAVSPRGGDFTSVYATAEYRWSAERAEKELGDRRAVDRFSPQGKSVLIRRCLLVSAALDSLGLCKVPALTMIGDFDLKEEASLTAAVTGWDLSSDDLLEIGERIINAERLLSLRYGAEAGDDKIPDRFIEEAVGEGPAEGHTVELRPMVEEFYRAMGWDAVGCPSEGKLAALDLVETL